MLDQSFSSHNFERIFLIENRKGNIKKNFLPEAYYEKHEEFKRIAREKREEQNASEGILSQERLEHYADILDEINQQKALIRINAFNDISARVENTAFHFNLEFVTRHNAYRIPDNNPAAFFAMKQLMRNVNKTFKVKQASRNKIISQLFRIIEDGYNKIVVRTDIRSFYDNIPHDRLLEKLQENKVLSHESLNLIKRTLFEFDRIKDTSQIPLGKGIPKGVGISAYLSEVYMKEVDASIKKMDGLVYYARYVDDIIAVFVPETISEIPNYLMEMKKIVQAQSLELNESSDKTKVLSLHKARIGNFQDDLTFLGYKFDIKRTDDNTEVKIEMSDEKIDRYIRRIEAAILEFNEASKHNHKYAKKLLLDRLKFLAGNYHLNHSKRTIKAGIYYSNSQLSLDGRSNYNSLNVIQDRFIRMVFNLLEPHLGDARETQKLRLFVKEKINFKNGFFNRHDNFYSFNMSQKEMQYYSRKQGNELISKFDLIKSIWYDV